MFSFVLIRFMVLIAGSAGSDISRAVKMETADFNFYIGKNIILFGYHIHHYYFGILLIAVAGWLAITGNQYFTKEKLALMYGAGLGLFMDEIGLLLTVDYFSSLSYLLGLFLLGIFLNIIYFPFFWEKIRTSTRVINNKIYKKTFIQTNLNNLINYSIKFLDKTSKLIMDNKIAIVVVMVIILILDYLMSIVLPLIF